MKIPLLINDEKKMVECETGELLLSVLRKLNLLSVKFGCSKGSCGACMILLDGLPVPSCAIPAIACRESSIITMEYFSKTPDFTDIQEGFTEAGVQTCGYCNAGKYFVAYHIISTYSRPTKELIQEHLSDLTCKCVETDLLTLGVLKAGAKRRKRLTGATHGKK